MKYVIIGNSAGAVGCVEGIRSRDQEGKITILSSEPHHTYSRPLISYLLQGKTDEERMKYRPESFYDENNCKTLLGRTATAIHPEAKTVVLEDGEEIPYDKLLVATGSTPFVPDIPGLDGVEKKFTFTTLDDARALDGAVEVKRVLVLGAGLIGLKCAEGIAWKAGRVTVTDLADHILPSILDEESAGIVKKHIEGFGVDFLLDDAVERFSGDTAHFKSGKKVAFDLLVVAVGVRPNTALVKDAGGEVNRGVVTDEFCRTSLPDVYAAGDCTESYDISQGESRVLALLPAAYMQGECAGIHMTGGEKPYDKAIPMNAIGFFGLHLITAGNYDGERHVQSSEGNYKLLVTGDNLLKGYILLGDVVRAGIYTALIRDQVPLDTVDFDLVRERPQLMAFTKKERIKKLGGVGR